MTKGETSANRTVSTGAVAACFVYILPKMVMIPGKVLVQVARLGSFPNLPFVKLESCGRPCCRHVRSLTPIRHFQLGVVAGSCL